ncbi:MAG: DNA-protecting protein DprA, partial [Clostridia bacterium]|nr:DNA-protecting protein DprA [Clostridia bacterium]
TAMDILARCEEENLSVITLQDAVYPARLKNIYDPPVVLSVKGKLPVLDEEAAIAVVGTRDATPYGLKMARRFGHDLAACGGLVVSGLTRGIDRSAAEGALEACGKVIGVLGTGHDSANGDLYEDVAVSGALVSEYPPGMRTYKEQFRYRNRVTAGLSVGALVVEAPEGRYSLNDKVSDIMESFFGKLWFVMVGLTIKKKMDANKKDGEKKEGGFDLNMKDGGLMQMMGGFTVLRMTSMMGMINVSFSKEELLKLNKKLNRIRKPKNLKK